MKAIAAALLLLASNVGLAQTSSGIARHIQWGSSLPATCSPTTGDVFFVVSAGPVGSFYTCTAPNTWAAGGGGGGTPGGSNGQIQYNNSGSLGGISSIYSSVGYSGAEVQRGSNPMTWTLTVGGNLTMSSGTSPQSVTLATVPCDVIWTGVLISVGTAFTGGTGALTGYFAHNGVQLTAALDLTTGGGYLFDRPAKGCTGTGGQTITLVIVGNGVNPLNGFNAGVVTITAAGFIPR